MSVEPELEAMTTVLGALKSLDANAQNRVLRWVIEKLDLATSAGSSSLLRAATPEGTTSEAHKYSGQLPQAALVWAKQTGISEEELELVFHQDGEATSVIASSVPGKNTAQKVINCYLLTGLSEFLRTGDANFTDKAARALCTAFGCFDTTNHAKYMNTKGNEFTGSKEKGWTLTAPGKKRGATLVKEIAAIGT